MVDKEPSVPTVLVDGFWGGWIPLSQPTKREKEYSGVMEEEITVVHFEPGVGEWLFVFESDEAEDTPPFQAVSGEVGLRFSSPETIVDVASYLLHAALNEEDGVPFSEPRVREIVVRALEVLSTGEEANTGP